MNSPHNPHNPLYIFRDVSVIIPQVIPVGQLSMENSEKQVKDVLAMVNNQKLDIENSKPPVVVEYQNVKKHVQDEIASADDYAKPPHVILIVSCNSGVFESIVSRRKEISELMGMGVDVSLVSLGDETQWVKARAEYMAVIKPKPILAYYQLLDDLDIAEQKASFYRDNVVGRDRVFGLGSSENGLALMLQRDQATCVNSLKMLIASIEENIGYGIRCFPMTAAD